MPNQEAAKFGNNYTAHSSDPHTTNTNYFLRVLYFLGYFLGFVDDIGEAVLEERTDHEAEDQLRYVVSRFLAGFAWVHFLGTLDGGQLERFGAEQLLLVVALLRIARQEGGEGWRRFEPELRVVGVAYAHGGARASGHGALEEDDVVLGEHLAHETIRGHYRGH
jgi:hypothetical protein